MNTDPIFKQSAAGRRLAEHAVAGELVLQQCVHCDAVQYPPREVCGQCLADKLDWQEQPTQGRILAVSELHHSLEAVYQDRLPWTVASIKLACGPVVLAQLPGGALAPDTPVTVTAAEIGGGNWLLQASAHNGGNT